MTATDAQAMDAAKTEAFAGKVLGDMSGVLAAALAGFGDVLGLWKELDSGGPATSEDLARRTGTNERYVREWLAGVHAAGYVEYDPNTSIYTLPPHAAACFAHEGGPVFMGGSLQMLRGMVAAFDDVCDAFRNGGGVPQSRYGDDVYEGICRFTRGWFDNLLVQTWLPLVPEVEAKLVAGCGVADVGTGAGRALITLARQYSNSRYVGYDVFPHQIELAIANAKAAGLDDRIRFEVLDGSLGLPDTFDVITTFDVIHDAVDPAGLLRVIREALRPGGRYLCLDMHASDRPEENVGPLATMLYGCSLHYCMTTSLAHGGAGLGTCGFNPVVAERMSREAAFAACRLVDIDNPFNHLYEMMP